MDHIIRYANGHRDTQLVALSTSEAGIGVLNDMQKKMRFAGEELQRMEDESGTPLNDEQAARVDTYFKASQRIRKILLITQKMLPPMVANLSIFKTPSQNW